MECEFRLTKSVHGLLDALHTTDRDGYRLVHHTPTTCRHTFRVGGVASQLTASRTAGRSAVRRRWYRTRPRASIQNGDVVTSIVGA